MMLNGEGTIINDDDGEEGRKLKHLKLVLSSFIEGVDPMSWIL